LIELQAKPENDIELSLGDFKSNLLSPLALTAFMVLAEEILHFRQ
jgi:hypothetical protein